MDFLVNVYGEFIATLALLLAAGPVFKNYIEWKLLPVSVSEVSK